MGRWLGYTTAVLFALLSLYQIAKTFKRVLLFQVYMRKSPVEQDEMVNTLAGRQSAGPRMLARVMSTMQPASRSNENQVCPLVPDCFWGSFRCQHTRIAFCWSYKSALGGEEWCVWLVCCNWFSLC